MPFDQDYLRRNLDGRIHDVQEDIARRVKAIQNSHAATGRLKSGATLIAFEGAAVDSLKEAVSNASKFIFELTAGEEPANKSLGAFAETVERIVFAEIAGKADRLGLGKVTTDHLEKVTAKLGRIKEGLLDDFAHGMHGSERLKKDPIVNAVINQTNSPGAVAQVGAGSFSQSAFAQQQHQLIEVIDQALKSPEFEALEPDQQQGFRDIAEVVKAEASSATPDAGKLQRWSKTLINFAANVGMKVASSAIAQVLVKIFT